MQPLTINTEISTFNDNDPNVKVINAAARQILNDKNIEAFISVDYRAT